MNKQDFLKAVRQSGGKFRADNIIVSTGTAQVHGKGYIEVASGRFRIHVTLNTDSRCPELPQGFKAQRDFWLVQGVIEDEIAFSLRSLPSNRSRNVTFGQPERSILEFSTNRMELTPTPFDRLTSKELYEMQRQAIPKAQADQIAKEAAPTASEESNAPIAKPVNCR
jgi:hypothetical protein